MRRLRLPSQLFKLPVSQARLCHTNHFSDLTQNQLARFQYLGKVGLLHFRSRDFSWYEIDLVKRLMEGDPNYNFAPLSVETAFAQLEAFKKLPVNALNKEQLYLLNELYPYGLRREHLDLTKIRPTDAIKMTVDDYREMVCVLDLFSWGMDAMCYTGGWKEIFEKAFTHHVMWKVTGFDVHADLRGGSHNFFAEISRNPASHKKAVEEVLDEIKGMDMIDLALFSYGVEKKDISSIKGTRHPFETYLTAHEKLWSKRLEIKKAFTTTEDSSSPKP